MGYFLGEGDVYICTCKGDGDEEETDFTIYPFISFKFSTLCLTYQIKTPPN